MSRFAEGSGVSVEKTRIEVEETLRRFGADGFSSGYDRNTAFIVFRARGRFIRLTLALPDQQDTAFTLTPARGTPRSPAMARDAYEAECRRRWRSLALLVKAKLVAVQDEITDFETEFLPHIVLPDGRSVAEMAKPAVAIAYEKGEMPQLLLGGPST